MLRRKLLVIFGSLVFLLVVLAIMALWMLQGMLTDLDHIQTKAMAVVDDATQLSAAITSTQIDLYQLELGRQRHLDGLIRNALESRRLLRHIGDHYVVREPECEPVYKHLLKALGRFEGRVSSLATAQDPVLAKQYNTEALALAMDLHTNVRWIEGHARAHAGAEQEELVATFRWFILGMGLGCMLVVNVAVIALLRAAGMVLRPVDKLVEASRQLAQEKYEHRTEIDQADEFRELAQVYNEVAERFQTLEQRRMEILTHVSTTLSHELNNALGAVDLQLEVIGRRVGEDDGLKQILRQIQEGLRRMADTVDSLKRVRRIVLTDYVPGTQMLDLSQSIQRDPPDADEPAEPVRGGDRA